MPIRSIMVNVVLPSIDYKRNQRDGIEEMLKSTAHQSRIISRIILFTLGLEDGVVLPVPEYPYTVTKTFLPSFKSFIFGFTIASKIGCVFVLSKI